MQMALPWSSSLDVAYVGQHSFHVLNAFQSLTAVNINAIDFGAAFLPQNQDPTRSAAVGGGGRLRRLRAGAAAADPRLREHRPAVAGVRAHLPFDAVLGDPALPQRRVVRRQLHAEPQRQRHHRRAAAPAAQRRRVVLHPRGSGDLQRPDEEPGPAAPHRQGELHLGSAGLADDRIRRGSPRRSSTTGSCPGSSPAAPAPGTTSPTSTRTTART